MPRFTPFVFLLISCTALAEDRTVFSFQNPDTSGAWQAVNDGVMGGRSKGGFRFGEDRTLEFSGTLSLENNGGFASIRTPVKSLNLLDSEQFVVRVRGDGRTYSMNVYTGNSNRSYSWRQEFSTVAGKWIDVCLPISNFLATWRGRRFPSEKLQAAAVSRLGFLLGDKKPGTFRLQIQSVRIESAGNANTPLNAACEGRYKHHLQGVCASEDSVWWSFTTSLVRTDRSGKKLVEIPVDNHHGDLCLHSGRIYVAVNLGRFNDPEGNADSWVYVYDADTLREVARHEVQQVFHGAGGICVRDNHFFVVGGLPDGVEQNFVYEYDQQFRFVNKHVLESGHTHLGIQTAAFANGKWWFGCYGTPAVTLVASPDFSDIRRFQLNCSLGICGLPDGTLLTATGQSSTEDGCDGRIQIAVPDADLGYVQRFPAVR